jgi:hypothetical protein
MTPATHTRSTDVRPTARARKGTSRDHAASPHAHRAKPTTPPAVVGAPSLSLDPRLLADLQDVYVPRVRAMIRRRPLACAGGALATGFVLGGGWKTRVGRLLLFGAARYAAVRVVERFLEE